MEKRTGMWKIAIVTIVTLLAAGTAHQLHESSAPHQRTRLLVATTTSLYDTGLLDTVETHFETDFPVDVGFVSAGTGLAIQYAERGDADMILVHSPSQERAFLEEGIGVCRKVVAFNFFTIVGPQEDPVKAFGLAPTEALRRIVGAGREHRSSWVSRGDDSGTHAKEKALWAEAGFNWTELRAESWFIESGNGMGKTLQIVNEKSAYALTDMGTFLKYDRNKLVNLAVIVESGRELLNVYSVIAVAKGRNPEANFDAAITFIEFLVSEEGQRTIDNFGVDENQQKLFYPAVSLLRDGSSTLANWIQEQAYFDGEECPEEYQDNQSGLYP